MKATVIALVGLVLFSFLLGFSVQEINKRAEKKAYKAQIQSLCLELIELRKLKGISANYVIVDREEYDLAKAFIRSYQADSTYHIWYTEPHIRSATKHLIKTGKVRKIKPC